MSHKGRNEEQSEETYIYNIGKGLEDAVVRHEDKEGKKQGSPNPDNLHAAAGREVEDAGSLVEVIASAADAHPTQCQKHHVDKDGEPVDGLPKRRSFLVNLAVLHSSRIMNSVNIREA